MTNAKRSLDLLLAMLVGLLLLLPFLLLLLAMLAVEGRPLFYRSERMRGPQQGFTLYKLRSMRPAEGGNHGVSGGDKSGRISGFGRFLRRTRLDEIPQLLNVVLGDMSLVGPRPPLRQYVELYPELYARVLLSRPGITGLASLVYSRHEENLLAACRTATETEAVYRRRCIAQKARIDLIYQRRQTVALDLWLIALTAARLLPGRSQSTRLPRLR